ncbi:MAG: hypothetical protein H6728_11955 [Myxococcales bacterium]|nr:hypothetical protein [Myxococcales bacterium]
MRKTAKRPNRERHRAGVLGLLVFSWLFSLAMPSVSWGMKEEDSCQGMFSDGAFLEAADCYDKLFQRVDKEPSWASQRKLLKDRFLRHGSLCYRQAARKAATKEEANFLRERAAALLLRTFREGYCESSFRCRMNRQQAEALKKEIGYTPLVVVTGSKEAKVSVKGYKYQGDATGDFNQPLRPGHYQIRVQGVAGKVQSKKIELKRGVMVTLNVTPAQIQIIEKRVLVAKKVPPLVIAGYVVGGSLLVAGLGLVIYASVEQARLNALISNPETAKTITDEEFYGKFNQAGVFKVAGFVAGGVGVVLLAGAIFAQLAANRASQPPSSDAQLPRSRLLTLEN